MSMILIHKTSPSRGYYISVKLRRATSTPRDDTRILYAFHLIITASHFPEMSLGLQLLFAFFGFVLGHAKTALIFFQVPIVQIIFF